MKTELTLTATYKGHDIEVKALMGGIEDTPEIVEFTMDYFDGVDKILRELHEKSEAENEELFGGLDWSQAYREYIDGKEDYINDQAHEESKY